jgi:SAM-dependent methyltransferase
MTGLQQEAAGAELALQEAWFRAQGLSGPTVREIHREDEMARLDLMKTEPARRRMFYMRTGYEAFRVLEHALGAAGRELAAAPSLLDFACGYGRPLRFLVRALAPERVWASDVVAPAVEFVGRTFGVHAFRSATRPADVRFGRRFSVVCVFSLFTHLPRASFESFLRTLYELLEPDGLLLFSTHNPSAIPEGERDPSGFTFLFESGIPHLDPREYGSTFVAPELVRGLCRGLGLEHVWTLEHELWRIQDVHVVARRDVPGLAAWTHVPLARGAILRAGLDPSGWAFAEGYVRVPAREAPLRSVEVVLDGARREPCPSRPHPLPLPESEGGRHFLQTDWRVEGPAHELRAGEHTLAALATTGSGVTSCFDVALLARE